LLVCLFPLGRSTVQSHQRGDLTCFFFQNGNGQNGLLSVGTGFVQFHRHFYVPVFQDKAYAAVSLLTGLSLNPGTAGCSHMMK